MPQNIACDPITDQEMAFVHLILSGTMTDRRAAKAVGLNPDTAANTKSKPRVHAYMLERRDVGRAVEGTRTLNIGRDQVLNRLWELATLSHEATRGSITGQMKALAMIAAIEGLIPSGTMKDPRRSLTRNQPATPPDMAEIDTPESRRPHQHQAEGTEPSKVVAAAAPRAEAPSAAGPETRK